MSEDWGLLLVRVIVGGLLAGHGAQKLFGWFGGYGFSGTRDFFGGVLRLRPAGFWTALAIAAELGGGLLFALGLLNPLGALGIVGAMLMALILAHWPRLWVTENGIEYPLVLLTVALAIAITGPGAYSLDAALGLTLPAPATLLVGLAATLGGAALALATRTRPAVDATQASGATSAQAA